MKRIIALLCLMLHCSSYCLIAGSSILVSVQSLINFPSIDINNEMLGFGWFKNGFTLEDSSTTCKFNSVFPVSGTVNMNGGELTLETDLYFANDLNLQGFGSINGQSYSVYFPSGLSSLPADAATLEDVSIILSNDLKLSSTLSFKGTTTIKGNGHTIFLGEDGGIFLHENAHLIFEDIDIRNAGKGNIALANDNAHFTFDDTNIFFDENLTFTIGSFVIKDQVHFYGDKIFHYDSAQTSTIKQFAEWRIHDDMQLHIGKKTSVFDVNPLWFEDQSSVLRLSNCHLRITQYGFDLLRGSIAYDSQVTLDTVGESAVTGLIIGNGNVEDDPIIEFDAGASVQLESSYFTFNTGASNVIKTGAHKSARLSRNIGSNIYVMQDLLVPSMKIEMLSEMIPPMNIASGKTIEYDDTLIVLPGAEFDITSGRRSQLTFLLNGNDSIFFTKGTLPLSLDIEGSGNRIMGNGNVVGAITLKNSTAELITELDGEFDNALVLQGGTFKLDDDVRFGTSAHLTGSGVMNLQEYSLHLPPIDFMITSSINWHGQNAAIHLNGKACLSTTSTCNGVITINGNGNVLELSDTGKLEIAPNSTLILKNIRVEGIKDENIYLTDSTSSLVLNDVLWRQKGDYTFKNGSFLSCHEVTVVGESAFIYDSSQTSTISAYAELTFKDNSTLHIGRATSASSNPLYFENSLSQLAFDDASWHITNEGLQLARGSILFDNAVHLDMDSTSTVNGLVLGSNVEDQDAILRLNANATWHFDSGHFVYNNYDPNGIIAAGNQSARIVRTSASFFHMFTDLNMANFVNEAFSLLIQPIQIALGKTLNLNNMRAQIFRSDFEINNLNQTSTISQMSGDSSVLVDQSSQLPFPILVSGQNNFLRGAGSIKAPIALQDSASELTFALQGELQGAIALNGGTIIVSSNLDFGPDAEINGEGTINIGSQKVSLGASDMNWTATARFVSNGGILDLNAHVTFDTTTTISGTLLINGNGNTLEFKGGAHVVIEDGAMLIYRDLRLENIAEKHVTCLGPNSKIVINDSIVILGGDLTFDEGSLTFVNQVDVIGSYTFSYDSIHTSTIKKNSVLHITDNATLVVGKNNPLIDEPIYFEDNTASLLLDNCSFLITSSGMQFSTGTIRVDREVAIDVNSTSTQNGLVLGSGQPNDTLRFELSPGATVKFNSGHTIYNVQHPNAIVSLSPTARFVRANASVLHANYPVSLSQMTLDHSKYSITTLDPSASLAYENTNFVVPGSEFSTTGVQTSPSAITLPGSGELYLSKGAYPLGTIVAGSSNIVHGNGNITGPVLLANSASELQWALNGGLANTFSLAGGTITLLQDMHLARGITASTGGTIDLGASRFILGTLEIDWPTDMNFIGASGEVNLNNDVHLNGIWTFTGDCVLNGNGNALFLGDTGQIIVENSSKLRLKNVLIRDIAGNNIRCVDDNGVIILDCVDWLQDEAFTFSHGALQWSNNVHMRGGQTFAYQTVRTSTLLRQSMVDLDTGFTFTYDPINSQARDLIQFEDNTAILQLTNASFVANTNGIHLTKGTLNISGDSTCAADNVIDENNINQLGNIEIGDTQESNDLYLRISIGAVLRLSSGALSYKNVSANSLVMNNELSTIALMPNTLLNVDKTMNTGIGRLEVSTQAGIIIATGEELIGSIFELG